MGRKEFGPNEDIGQDFLSGKRRKTSLGPTKTARKKGEKKSFWVCSVCDCWVLCRFSLGTSLATAKPFAVINTFQIQSNLLMAFCLFPLPVPPSLPTPQPLIFPLLTELFFSRTLGWGVEVLFLPSIPFFFYPLFSYITYIDCSC